MDPNLISALIGLVGGLIGVVIGAYCQRRVTHSQLCRETTLHLYDRLDDSDILESRIRADQLLSTNAALDQPQTLVELYGSLPREDWRHISRTRHFLEQIGLLRRIGYLDEKLAVPLFSNFVNYWIDRHFGPLEDLEMKRRTGSEERPCQWRMSVSEFRKLFPSSFAPHPAATLRGSNEICDARPEANRQVSSEAP